MRVENLVEVVVEVGKGRAVAASKVQAGLPRAVHKSGPTSGHRRPHRGSGDLSRRIKAGNLKNMTSKHGMASVLSGGRTSAPTASTAAARPGPADHAAPVLRPVELEPGPLLLDDAPVVQEAADFRRAREHAPLGVASYDARLKYRTGPSSFRAWGAGVVCRARWCFGGEGRRRRPDYRSGRSGGRVRGPLDAC